MSGIVLQIFLFPSSGNLRVSAETIFGSLVTSTVSFKTVLSMLTDTPGNVGLGCQSNNVSGGRLGGDLGG